MVTHKFNPGDVLRKINEAEARFPVNDWNINGLKIWPFIRTSFSYSQNKNPNTKKKPNRRSLAGKMISNVKMFFAVPLEYLRVKSQIKKSKRLFVGSLSHRALINGVYINKYFDSAAADFQKQSVSSTILQTSPLLNKSQFYNNQSLFSLWFLIAFFEGLKKFSPKKRYSINLEGYDEFYQYALENFEHTATIKNFFAKDKLAPRMVSLYERKEFFKDLLKDSKIESAYFLCYYSGLLYPLIAACNELNIATTDIQHGGQGYGHYSYDNWSACPPEGYMLLPRYFWNWDQNSADVINQWTKRSNYHRAISVGNPWTETSLEFYDQTPPYSGYVLVNMNEIVLEEFIVETILKFGNQKKWVLRMHPRTYQNRAALEKQLKERAIEQYAVIEDSNQVPVSVSILHCSHVVSKPSGTIIEAISLGLKPILIRTHIKYYDHYIDSGEVAVLEQYTSEQFVRLLNEVPANTPEKARKSLKDKSNKFLIFEALTNNQQSA